MTSEPRVEFSISMGLLTSYDSTDTPTVLGPAYAGNGACLNDPDKTWVKNHGPLPTGTYAIGAAIDQPYGVGEFALPLTPDPSNVMWDRGSFFVHGDNPAMNHTASDGCVVCSMMIRSIVSKFSTLVVVP